MCCSECWIRCKSIASFCRYLNFFNLTASNEDNTFAFQPTLFDTITHYRRMQKIFLKEKAIETDWGENVRFILKYRVMQPISLIAWFGIRS